MAAIIGALRGVLSMDSAAFESGAKRAKSTMGGVERRMLQMATKMEGAGRRMSLGLTLPLAGAASVAIKSSLQVVDAQAKMAQSLGTTVASLQVLQRAADLSGVSVGEVEQATIQLTKRLSQAAGGAGPAAKALDRLRLSAADLQELPLDERLAKIQDGLAAYVPEAERAAVASELFGSRAGLIFTRIDSSTLRLASEDVTRFGVAISEVDADQIELTNDALSRMGLAGQGLANQLTVALAPALQDLSDNVAAAATWFNDLSDGTKRFIATGALIAGTVGPAAIALGLVLKVTAPLGIAMGGVISTVALAPVRFAAAAKSAVALEVALGATSTKAAVAGVAIKGLQRGLLLLRGAVFATGIGALVVGAGYLAMKFNDLVVATGGWGGALSALGDLAAGVWEGIKTSASAIGPSLSAIWADVNAGFTRLMQDLNLKWGNFLWSLSQGMDGIPVLEGFAQSMRDASDGAIDKVMELDLAASTLEGTAIRLRKEASGKLKAGFKKSAAALKTLSNQMDTANASLEEGDQSADGLKDALADLGDGVEDLGDDLDGAAAGLSKTTEAAADLGQELSGPLSGAVDGVSRAFGDWISGGLRDFKSLWDGIKDSAARGLSDLATQFAKSQLQLAIGVNVSGGTAANTAGSLLSGGGQSGGGLLSGLLGQGGAGLLGAGGFLAGIGGGASAALGLGGFSSSGIFSIGANAALGSAVTGAGALASTIGAALPVVGIALAAFSFFSTKTKELDTGIRLTVTDMDTLVESFRTVQKSRFWGLSKKISTAFSVMEAEAAAPFVEAVSGIQMGIMDAADALGIGSSVFDDFTHQFKVSTRGLSEEEAQAAVQEALTGLGDAFADMVPGLAELQRQGEGASGALSRLYGSFAAVNNVMDLLGHSLFDESLRGADLASDLVDLFGGSDQMASVAQDYWTGFYSEAERTETVLRRLGEEFGDLGLAMPASREGFRELIEGLDLSTEGGQALYAELMGLAGALGEVLPQISAFTAEIAGITDEIGGEIGGQIEGAREMVSEARAAADQWRATADSLRDFVADLVNSDLTAASSAQATARQRAQLDAAFAAVRAGDAVAAASLPDLARTYLQSARDTATSDLEYRRIAAQVQGQVNFAAGLADLESGNDEVLAALYERQIEVLTNLGSFLQLEGLTNEQVGELSQGVQDLAADWDGTVDAFEASLQGLAEAIETAEAFSYDDLVGALDVAVALDDNAPDWLREMVTRADEGIRTTLDFVIRRNDLSPADRWIATHALSEHVATLDLVLGADLDEDTRRLALTTAEELRRSLVLDLGQDLDAETRALVLTDTANLSRRINVALTGKGAETVAQLIELQSLIGAGGGTGRLTFGGGVVLEADTVFADLAHETGRLVEPMGRLSDMLDELRAAVEADRVQRALQGQIAALQAQGASQAASLSDHSEATGIIAKIEALEQQTGVTLSRSGGRDAELRMSDVSGRIIYDADFVTGHSMANIAAFGSAFWGEDGLEAQIRAYNSDYSDSAAQVEALRAQITALGGVPAFASGGVHTGGVRLVGERGWEIEQTGSSRIHSHAESVAMLDNRPIAKGLEELTRHVVSQSQMISMLMNRIATTVADWDEIGMPEVRV